MGAALARGQTEAAGAGRAVRWDIVYDAFTYGAILALSVTVIAQFRASRSTPTPKTPAWRAGGWLAVLVATWRSSVPACLVHRVRSHCPQG